MGETAEDSQVTQDQHVAQIETLHSSTAPPPGRSMLPSRARPTAQHRTVAPSTSPPTCRPGWLGGSKRWAGGLALPPTPWPGSGKARQCSLLVSDCHLISSTRSW